MCRIELHVSGDKQIGPAIAIVVSPGRPGRPSAQCNSGFLGNVGEGSIVIIVVKAILPKIRNVDVGPSVVVIISDGNAESPALIGYPGVIGHVAKRPIMIVVEQRGARCWRLTVQSGEGRAVDKVNIQPTIVVIIQEPYAGADGLENGFLLRGTGTMMKSVQASGFRELLEYRRRSVYKSSRSDGA